MKTVVISLGGSIIVPGEIDTRLVKNFIKLISAQTRKGHNFFIITGGGATARQYQKALREIANASADDLDWIGIAGTRINAKLLALSFGNIARQQIITDPTKRVGGLKKVNLVSGWKPGRSTDDDAVRIAKLYGARTIINLSNIDYVYSADPRKDKNARKFERMTWTQYLKQFGSKWKPGGNYPFDPVAAELAKNSRIKVIVLNGHKLENLKNYFAGRKFRGTIISPA